VAATETAPNLDALRTQATHINELLQSLTSIAQARPEGNKELCEALETVLSGKQLDRLVDTNGRFCRAEAVETLLSLGFPFALRVNPEDLESAQSSRARLQQVTRLQRLEAMSDALSLASALGVLVLTLIDAPASIRNAAFVVAAVASVFGKFLKLRQSRLRQAVAATPGGA
jgi:hypothetical protein